MRNSFINKIRRVHKFWQSRIVQVYVPPLWLCFLNSSWSTGLKFPIWTHHRIRPGNRASPVTELIWRGPKTPNRWTFWLATKNTYSKKFWQGIIKVNNAYTDSERLKDFLVTVDRFKTWRCHEHVHRHEQNCTVLKIVWRLFWKKRWVQLEMMIANYYLSENGLI